MSSDEDGRGIDDHRTDGRGTIDVLVVDDDFRVSEIHKGFVERVPGFRVVGVAHSASQTEKLHAQLQPDLVLLDIYLPDGHGTEILARLRAQRSVDCIVLSAARDLATVKRCLDLGALHYLVKPFEASDLVERLRDYATWRSDWVGKQELDQSGIDELFHGRGRPDVRLPKGLSPETMELVIEALAQADEALSTDDVAQLTGVSRVSVRRYLRHLADTDQATLHQDYGTPGRPRHRFRLT